MPNKTGIPKRARIFAALLKAESKTKVLLKTESLKPSLKAKSLKEVFKPFTEPHSETLLNWMIIADTKFNILFLVNAIIISLALSN